MAAVKTGRFDEAIELATADRLRALRSHQYDAVDRFSAVLDSLQAARRIRTAPLRQPRFVRCPFCGNNRQARMVTLGARTAVCRSCAKRAVVWLKERRIARSLPEEVVKKGKCGFCNRETRVFVGLTRRRMICGSCAAFAAGL
jgi:transcription elongation factor Elf1